MIDSKPSDLFHLPMQIVLTILPTGETKLRQEWAVLALRWREFALKGSVQMFEVLAASQARVKLLILL